jgi:hypothetical protein
MSVRDKANLLTRIDEMLASAIRLRLEGSDQTRFHRAQAYADGYMTALLDQGLVSQNELLGVVRQARAKVEGPSTRQVEFA